MKSKPMAKIPSGCSCWALFAGCLCDCCSPASAPVEKPLMNTTNAILIIMLSVATLTTILGVVKLAFIQLQYLLKQG
ncbi:hypothetical protein KCP78_22065 [Salmonella enterica subsp. enterica]|nr:hypothetical protein KCP78_22065 [Salmonella enterica subsp. enterica]